MIFLSNAYKNIFFKIREKEEGIKEDIIKQN